MGGEFWRPDGLPPVYARPPVHRAQCRCCRIEIEKQGERFCRAICHSRFARSYEDLVTDPGVDIIYIATPHPNHASAALLALEAGKHVMVEKQHRNYASPRYGQRTDRAELPHGNALPRSTRGNFSKLKKLNGIMRRCAFREIGTLRLPRSKSGQIFSAIVRRHN